MLFNSFEFLLGFLPAALLVYAAVRQWEAGRCWVLIIISLVFYGWWDVRFVPLLVGSVIVNWLAAWVFFRWRWRPILVIAMIADLSVLGWYKYTNFLISVLDEVTGLHAPMLSIILPLGISFFTFHHIIYLADCWRGRAPFYSFRDYALYITLFPQILAGPLVRHSEIIYQFHESSWRTTAAEQWSRGFVLITIGLAKKVLLADSIAAFIDPTYASAAAHSLSGEQAWLAALGFAFQIYFDFSGYSDMAIGLALLFGFTLPVNFDAPYRATSVQDFWRRWHMTLSRFLRDYLHSAGRQPARSAATACRTAHHHGARRVVARRRLAFRVVGSGSWRGLVGGSAVAKTAASAAGRAGLADDILVHHGDLGSVPCANPGRRDGNVPGDDRSEPRRVYRTPAPTW